MAETENSSAHRIMIIDDDQLTALALLKALKAEDLNIIAVANCSSALSEIRNNHYSLVFLEIGIADGAGEVILKEISRSSPSTCIIVMSAGITNEEMEGTLIAGNHYYLPKPFEVLQVKTLTNRILSGEARTSTGYQAVSGAAGKKRKSVRHPLPGDMTMFADPPGSHPGTPEQLSAKIVDISSGGMGVQTDLPLPPGQTFRLDHEDRSSRGIVRWSMVHENRFRAGIQFV